MSLMPCGWVRLAHAHDLVPPRHSPPRSASRPVMWEDVEHALVAHDISPFMLNRQIKQFENTFLGSCLAYDMGMIADDKEMAAALWRNLYGHSEDISAAQLAAMVEYVRAQQQNLDNQDPMYDGTVRWLPPPRPLAPKQKKA